MKLFSGDETVVVTGGSEGIGKAIAKAYLEEGLRVVIASRSIEKLEKAREELSAYGDVSVYVFDALSPEGFYSLASFAYSEYGHIDIWVNNVGASRMRSAGSEYTQEDISWTEKMCFDSAVHGSQAAFRYMKYRGGAIINISSLAARCGTAGRATLYASLKAGVCQLTRMLAAEYASSGVRVNCIMPGFTMTELAMRTISQSDQALNNERTLLRRMAEPDEIAAPAVFLSSQKASFITGVSLEVSGGRDIVLNPSFSYQ